MIDFWSHKNLQYNAMLPFDEYQYEVFDFEKVNVAMSMLYAGL